MSLVLRPYQDAAIEKLREAIRAGHKHIALQSPTGSGKTEMAFALILEALAKESPTAFIVDRLSILYQTEARLDLLGIPFGVLQAGHYRFRPYEKLQLCSSQTLRARGIMDGLRFIVVDEAHTMYKSTVEILDRYKDVVTIGLSATNFTKGLGKVYSAVVNAEVTDKLIEQEYLVPLKAFAAKRIDLQGVGLKSDGEWKDKEVEALSMEIVGDVVTEWIAGTSREFGGPVKTLVFSASVAHGEELCRQFQAAGHNFQQVSYKDKNDGSRRALIDEFRKDDSEITGLISVECLAKGFDVPAVMCGVGCRPYRKSFSSHIQAIGRVMRPYPGKTFALWHCHAGNILRFYPDMLDLFANGVTSLDESDLDSKVRKEPEQNGNGHACGFCGRAMLPKDETCPSCGKARPKRHNHTESIAGEMVAVDGKIIKKGQEWKLKRLQVQRELLGYAVERRNRDAANKYAYAMYMDIMAGMGKPTRYFADIDPLPPSREVLGAIQHHNIKYRYSKQKRK